MGAKGGKRGAGVEEPLLRRHSIANYGRGPLDVLGCSYPICRVQYLLTAGVLLPPTRGRVVETLDTEHNSIIMIPFEGTRCYVGLIMGNGSLTPNSGVRLHQSLLNEPLDHHGSHFVLSSNKRHRSNLYAILFYLSTDTGGTFTHPLKKCRKKHCEVNAKREQQNKRLVLGVLLTHDCHERIEHDNET